MFKWLEKLLKREPSVSYYTTDGGMLAPHPGMTDDDLYIFESGQLTGTAPNRRTWPTLEAYLAYRNAKHGITAHTPACDVPPAGWFCTRKSGHSGPCAAWPR